jgi:hypothetical protein
MLTAVAFEIALGVAVQIEPSSKDTPGHGAFPDRGAHDFALPCNLMWQADVNGQKFWHGPSNASGADFRSTGTKKGDQPLPQSHHHSNIKESIRNPLTASVVEGLLVSRRSEK